MLKSRVILVLVAVVAGSVGLALGRRPAETAGAAAPSASSPYAADSSPVRGLTAREVDDLLNGRGAGFARTAELNGHPGPRHAIDLADDLELTDDQRAAAERIFAGMSAAAKRLGVEIVGRERRLSAAFAAPGPRAGARLAPLSLGAVGLAGLDGGRDFVFVDSALPVTHTPSSVSTSELPP